MITMLDQAAYWHEWMSSLVVAGFTREEAVAMTTSAQMTQMWIQYAKSTTQQ